jgi:REP element-mobilizing transposase RayT
MSRNNLQLYIHLVFATKYRDHLITDKVEIQLHQFLWNKFLELKLIPLVINGMQDHVHLLLKIPAIISISSVSKNLKAPSSRFLIEITQCDFFECSRGYTAFTVSKKDVNYISTYIKNQKEYHQKGTVDMELQD